MGSKIIEIRRKSIFKNDQAKAHEQWLAPASRCIGAYSKAGATKSASGLEFWEEDILMPTLLEVDKTDREFRKLVSLYFDAIDNDIPAGGLKLEIGLETDNNAPISETNMPINVVHFIIYRHAIGHPHLAMTKQEAEKNQLKLYYLFSPEETIVTQYKENVEKDKALAVYFEYKENVSKVKMVLNLMQVKGLELMTEQAKVLHFKNLAEKQPGLFIKTTTDKEIETKYMISCLVEKKILIKVGDAPTYIIEESGAHIGNGIKEAVVWFNNPNNATSVGVLRAAYKSKAITPKELDIAE